MARQRTSPAEDLVVIVSKLPWWAGLILALLAYVILHVIALRPIMPHTVTPGHLGDAAARSLVAVSAKLGQYILPLLFSVGAIFSAITAARQKKMYNSIESRPTISAFNEMSWSEFETLVGEFFRRQGFKVDRQGGKGPDGGIDLVLRNKTEIHLVQCKQWKAYKVGVQPVRELYGVMAARGAAGGYVVTSGTFSQEARDFVRGLNIELVDGDRLRQMIEAARCPAATAAPSEASSQSIPGCPKCGSEMKKRVARQGANAGSEFWGCSTFPKCNGVLPLAAPAIPQSTAPAHERKACPLCGGELVLRQFQSGPKIGQSFYGCVPCKKGWPAVAGDN